MAGLEVVLFGLSAKYITRYACFVAHVTEKVVMLRTKSFISLHALSIWQVHRSERRHVSCTPDNRRPNVAEAGQIQIQHGTHLLHDKSARPFTSLF